MNIAGKLEFLKEINSPGNVFLEVFGTKKDYLPKICPSMVPLIELVKGNWGEVGFIIIVHYFLEGEELISEETVEAVDEESKSITYNFYGGDLMMLYKTLRIIFQIIPKGEKNFLKWMYEYETLNLDVPAPDKLKDFAFEVTSMIDAHYMKLKKNTDAQDCDFVAH